MGIFENFCKSGWNVMVYLDGGCICYIVENKMFLERGDGWGKLNMEYGFM